MIGIAAIRVLVRTRLNIEPYFPLKPTKVGFNFIGHKLYSELCQRLGLIAGFKDSRLKPKLLNRRLMYRNR